MLSSLHYDFTIFFRAWLHDLPSLLFPPLQTLFLPDLIASSVCAYFSKCLFLFLFQQLSDRVMAKRRVRSAPLELRLGPPTPGRRALHLLLSRAHAPWSWAAPLSCGASPIPDFTSVPSYWNSMFGGTIPQKRPGKEDMGGIFFFWGGGGSCKAERPARTSLAAGLGAEVYGARFSFTDVISEICSVFSVSLLWRSYHPDPSPLDATFSFLSGNL